MISLLACGFYDGAVGIFEPVNFQNTQAPSISAWTGYNYLVGLYYLDSNHFEISPDGLTESNVYERLYSLAPYSLDDVISKARSFLTFSVGDLGRVQDWGYAFVYDYIVGIREDMGSSYLNVYVDLVQTTSPRSCCDCEC